jgi:hypothetical protein
LKYLIFLVDTLVNYGLLGMKQPCPCKGGKQEKSGFLPFIRGGLGRGKKYLIHQS